MLRATLRYDAARRRRQIATAAAVRREWSRMGDDLDASWSVVGPRVAAIVIAAQLGAAEEALAYVPLALAEQGGRVRPEFEVDPGAFAGVATTTDQMAYGSLDALLYGSVVHARTTPAGSLEERLAVAGRHLDMLVHTQVADAGRMVSTTAIAVTPRTGWVRQVNPPCCKRCAVLAGKWFKKNDGFDRHPGCDCSHIPWLEATDDDPGINIGPEDVKDLTIAERKAIDLGADMNQVINASRKGSRSADGMWTTEGTTKRGWSSYVQRAIAREKGEKVPMTAERVGRRGAARNYVVRRTGPRPTPQAILRYSDNEDEMRRLLARSGYIVGDLSSIARKAA